MTETPEPIPDDDHTLAGRKRRSLGRNTAVMAAGTATSRVLGLARNTLLVAALGLNAVAANAFDIANKLPNAMFAVIAAGVINAALVPQIVKSFQRPGGERVVDRILTIGGVVALVVTLVFTGMAQVWMLLYTQDWPTEMIALGTAFAFWCIPQLFFYAMYTLFGQVLTAREQFGPFMWAPALNNVISIVGLVVYLGIFGRYVASEDTGVAAIAAGEWTQGRIALLAGSFTLGVAIQAVVLIWPMVRGGYRWRWRWRGPKGELASVRTVISWALAAVLLEQATVLMVTRVASAANADDASLSIAGNAAFTQALGLYLLPHSLVTVSLITALYPVFARHAANMNMPGLRAELSRGLRTAGVFTVFATAALVAVAPLVARLVMPTATPVEIESVAWVVMAMTLGLVPLGATVLFKRVYFVLEDARSIFFMHIPMSLAWLAVAYGFQWWTHPRWWVVGVGLGLAASNLTGVIVRAGGLRRRLDGIDGRRVVLVHLKAIVAAVPAGVVGWLVTRLIAHVWTDAVAVQGLTGFITAAVTIAVAGLAMLAVYGTGMKLLRVDELSEAARPLIRRLKRR